MKGFWIFRILFVTSGLIFAPVSFPCHGQAAGHTMSVNVPFAFEMGDKHFAPGVYTINAPLSGVIEVNNDHSVGMLLARDEQSNKPTTTAKIVFDRYGEHYFLRQVWFSPSATSYLECPESKSERQTKRSELASNSKKPSNVEIAMLRLP